MGDRVPCEICGEDQDSHVTDWGYRLPDVVWAIPEGERAEKARFSSDLCEYGDLNFIRCVLDMPFKDAPGSFGWGVWAEVDRSTFERYLELYDADGSTEPASEGTLANSIPACSGSLGQPVVIQFQDASKRPSLQLKYDESQLALEQRTGIDQARYHQILSILGLS